MRQRLLNLDSDWDAFGAAIGSTDQPRDFEYVPSFIEVHRAVAPQENKCKAGKNGHYRYEIYRYLDSQGRSGDSLSAKVTSSLG